MMHRGTWGVKRCVLHKKSYRYGAPVQGPGFQLGIGHWAGDTFTMRGSGDDSIWEPLGVENGRSRLVFRRSEKEKTEWPGLRNHSEGSRNWTATRMEIHRPSQSHVKNYWAQWKSLVVKCRQCITCDMVGSIYLTIHTVEATTLKRNEFYWRAHVERSAL
jgi:hypothetical protein